ncbi:MAG: phage tail protein [Bacteroidetes bacterium]|nr:phage tail protein [Bacteroidota bacterium]MBX7045743.1 tail fiber protein [Ignavibacteria bacterium]
MNLFRKKVILNPLCDKEKEKARRSFLRNSIAALFGATILTKLDDLYAMDSKTGYVYIKANGEVTGDFNPEGTSTPFFGQLACFAFSLVPNGWERCNGQLLNINTNTALFSLLGNDYGGNGTTTFGVPDLRGRAPIHYGTGPGLSFYSIGERAGFEKVALNQGNLPPHSHNVLVNSGAGTSSNPSGRFIAQNEEGFNFVKSVSNTTMSAATVSPAGGSVGHNNIQPVIALHYCIAKAGIFPVRP